VELENTAKYCWLADAQRGGRVDFETREVGEAVVEVENALALNIVWGLMDLSGAAARSLVAGWQVDATGLARQ
jgi:hypothetical protein